MNVMLIGFGMVLIPITVLMFVVVGMLFHLMSETTIEAYRDRNVIGFLVMLLLWFLVVGIALILIGNVMALVGGV